MPAKPESPLVEDGQRTQLFNSEIERAVLACILLEGGSASIALCLEKKVRVGSFYEARHGRIYEAMLFLYEKRGQVEELLLIDTLKSQKLLREVGGETYINQLSQRVETTIHLGHYLTRLHELYLLRRLVEVTETASREARDNPADVSIFIDKVESEVYQVSEDRQLYARESFKEVVDAAAKRIADFGRNKGKITGMSSGFLDLDRLTDGWHEGEMIVIAARPSMGKTALALNCVEHLVCKDFKSACLMFSLEMPAEQLALRLICSRARVNIQRIRDGFHGEAVHQINQAARDLKQTAFHIDDSAGLSVMELRAKARRLSHQLGQALKLIIVDYLQLLSGSDPRVPREQQIGEISRGIKACAKELKLPILVMAQLNRESEKEGRNPRMSDLRESGSIEQDADVILLIARDRTKTVEEEMAEDVVRRHLIIAKQRNGPIGIVPLTFTKSFTRFDNAAPFDDA